jgi:hypothetical protein
MVITCAADVVECILCQGYQMVYFQTQNPSLGKFGRALQWNMSAYFVVIWSILWSFGIFYGELVYYSSFGILHQEMSGNPVLCNGDL